METVFEDLFADATDRRFAAGAPLFHAGDPVRRMHFVRSGAVALTRLGRDGRATVFQRAGPGDVAAEASLYAERYHCDAVASSDALVSVVSTARFLVALRDDPQRAEAWAAGLAGALLRARAQAELRGLRTVSERVDAWLAVHGSPPPRGSLQAMAADIAVSREALYRELAKRRAAGAFRARP